MNGIDVLVAVATILIVIFSTLLLYWYYIVKKYEGIKAPGPKPIPVIGNILEFGTNASGKFPNVL